jgi:hypothetical protein
VSHVLGAVETVGFENIRNALIETLHHTIGFGRSGLGQSVLNVQRLAKPIELVFPDGPTLPTGKLDLHKHPARGTVNGHRQVAALALIGHLRQVLHIHVQV